jgi:hypothetical protein
MLNFHLFVVLSTLAFYILLKLFKGQIAQSNKTSKRKQSNLIYLTFVPILLYITQYLYFHKDVSLQTVDTDVTTSLPVPYPENLSTVSSNFQ